MGGSIEHRSSGLQSAVIAPLNILDWQWVIETMESVDKGRLLYKYTIMIKMRNFNIDLVLSSL